MPRLVAEDELHLVAVHRKEPRGGALACWRHVKLGAVGAAEAVGPLRGDEVSELEGPAGQHFLRHQHIDRCHIHIYSLHACMYFKYIYILCVYVYCIYMLHACMILYMNMFQF